MMLLVVGLTLQLYSVSAGVYTRWGKTTCSGDALPVYSGYVASATIAHANNGKNYVCLTSKPEWGTVVAGHQYSAQMYGVQYAHNAARGYNNAHFPWTNFNGQEPEQFPAPCVVCETPNVQVLMIPGGLNCPADWYAEYKGYIFSSYEKPSEWICLDGNPEPLGAKFSGWNGVLEVAEVACGVLPCNVYIDGNEISCVVCSK